MRSMVHQYVFSSLSKIDCQTGIQGTLWLRQAIDSMYGNRTPSYNVGYTSEEPSPPDPTLVPDRSGTGRHGENELGISLTASRHICSRLVVPSVC